MSLPKTKQATDQCLNKAINTRLDDLKAGSKKPDPGQQQYVDGYGNYHIKRTLKNLEDDPDKATMTMPYRDYKDWIFYGDYKSDQWASDLQLLLLRNAEEQRGDRDFDLIQGLEEQEDGQPAFDFSEMPTEPLDIEKDLLDDFTMLVIGRRRSGKSFFSRWCMFHLRHRFPYGIVITGTKLNNFWSGYVPEEFICSIEDIETVIDDVFTRQTMLLTHPEWGIDPRMFVILDDVMGEKYRIKFSTALSTIFTNGRHFQIFLLITAQDAKAIGPDLRENTDTAVIFRVFEGGRKEVIYQEWLSYFNSREREYRRQTAKFFWQNTGMIDSETGLYFKEKHEDDPCTFNNVIPQAIAVLQGRVTDDLMKIMKKVVAEDPGDFYLGRRDYYVAAATGRYSIIKDTSTAWAANLTPAKKEKMKAAALKNQHKDIMARERVKTGKNKRSKR